VLVREDSFRSIKNFPGCPTRSSGKLFLRRQSRSRCVTVVMFAMAYDAGLRREELCTISTNDIDPSHRLLHIRAEHTKGRRARTVPYSAATGVLYGAYLHHRREISRERGPLFLSESRRNHARPISHLDLVQSDQRHCRSFWSTPLYYAYPSSSLSHLSGSCKLGFA